MNKGLTLTIVFKSMSLNYGEGIGNISELKKLTCDAGVFTYLSRQAIRYDIFRMLKEYFNIDDKENPLTGDSTVVQFSPDVNVRDYIEADLFGYMKTVKGEGSRTRSAVVRISPAVALEPFHSDLEWGTNKSFADRMNVHSNKEVHPNPFQFEHQDALYSYTITIDLNRVGKDEHDNINIANNEKADRVKKLIEIVKVLNRDIKGRTESLNPMFVIGGVYNVKNPFFLNKIKVSYDQDKKAYSLSTKILNSTSELSFNGEKVKDKTKLGYISGFWANEDEFKSIPNNCFDNVNDCFDSLIKSIDEAYNTN